METNPTQALEHLWTAAELARRLSDVLRLAVVHEVQTDPPRVRMRYGPPGDAPAVTAPLPWFTARAGQDRTWWTPAQGEQGLILAPSGDLEEGFVLFGLWQDAFPPPSTSADVTRHDWSDGSWVEHDRQSGKTRLYSTGNAEVEAPLTKVIGPGEVTGVLTVGGNLVVGGKIVGADGGAIDIEASRIDLN